MSKVKSCTSKKVSKLVTLLHFTCVGSLRGSAHALAVDSDRNEVHVFDCVMRFFGIKCEL